MKNILILILIFAGFQSEAQILQLRSKQDVVLNVVSLNQGKVRMVIDQETRNSLAIEVSGRYVEDATGDVIRSFNFAVPNADANGLGAVPIPQGTSLIDTRNMQLYAGVMSTIQAWKDFGLDAKDWEVYIQVVIDPVLHTVGE